jgi:hypothetical protein
LGEEGDRKGLLEERGRLVWLWWKGFRSCEAEGEWPKGGGGRARSIRESAKSGSRNFLLAPVTVPGREMGTSHVKLLQFW